MHLLAFPTEVLENVAGFLDVQSAVNFAKCNKQASDVVDVLLQRLWHSIPWLEEWVLEDVWDRICDDSRTLGLDDYVGPAEELSGEEMETNARKRAKLELTVWSECLGSIHAVLEVIGGGIDEKENAFSCAKWHRTAADRLIRVSASIRKDQDQAQKKLYEDRMSKAFGERRKKVETRGGDILDEMSQSIADALVPELRYLMRETKKDYMTREV